MEPANSGLQRQPVLAFDRLKTSGLMLRDGRGAMSCRLFAVRPVTKAAFREMTAVPDIRRQRELLAEHLAGIVKASLA